MKKAISSVALIAAAFAFTSTAAASNSSGKLISYSKSTGKLVVFNAKLGSTTYVVNAKTNCGVSFGQSGDQISCKTLNAAKYDHKPVHITWTRNSAGKRVASLVSVDLS
jgi:hypothetical protein